MPTPAPLDLEALSLDDLKRLVVELLLRVAAQEDEIRAVNRRQDRAPWRHEERVPGSVQRHYCLQSMVEHFFCWVSPVKPEAAVGGGP